MTQTTIIAVLASALVVSASAQEASEAASQHDVVKKVATGSLSSQREQANELVGSSPKPLTAEEIATITEEHFNEWLRERQAASAEIRSKIAIKGRVRDPFGFSSRSSIGPKSSVAGTQSAASDSSGVGVPQQEITAGMAVDTLQIVGVSENRQEFFVGARTIREGDTLTLAYAGRTFVLKVARVTATEIIFEENDGKKAVKPLAIVPPDSHPMMQPLAR